MTTIEVGKMWGGLVTYRANTSDAFVDAFHNFIENIDGYRDASVIPFWSYMPEMGGEVIMVAYEDVTGTEDPEILSEFMEIPDKLASTMRIDTHKKITDELEIADGYR